KHTLGGATFVSNFILYFEGGYWDVESHRKVLLHLWSLGVEEQFYLVFPIVLFVIYKLSVSSSFVWKRLFIALLALFLLSLALNLSLSKIDRDLDFYMPFTRFWELLAGSLLALYLRKPDRAKPSSKVLIALLVIGVALLINASFTTTQRGFPGYKALFPVIGTALVIYAGSFNSVKLSLINRILSFRPIVGVGLISYPLYLWHWVLLSFAWIIVGGWNAKSFELVGLRGSLILIAIALSILTYYLIERPIRFGKKGRGIKAILLVVALVGVGLYGAFAYKFNNLLMPFKIESLKDVSQALSGYKFIEYIDCKKQYRITNGYCIFNDQNGSETIAIMGDSFSWASFQAIAEFNAKKGRNTLSIYDVGHLNSGKVDGSLNPVWGQFAANDYKDKVFDLVTYDNQIRKVFFIVNPHSIEPIDFYNRIQNSVDRLIEANKKVYVVANQPWLPKHIKDIIVFNPLKLKLRDDFEIYREERFKAHKEYYEEFAKIKGATIISTFDIFCPTEKCLYLDENGIPLYSDHAHLSVTAGGRFLVEKVLKPYLDE
ncbi:MAG: acyltransferase, partial [Helicobacteraceae bacterium]|nr:acyltransferase [Helicobacteraceae bacterium]